MFKLKMYSFIPNNGENNAIRSLDNIYPLKTNWVKHGKQYAQFDSRAPG